jgi:hypothetical protein
MATNGMQETAHEALMRQHAHALAGPRPKTVAPVADAPPSTDDITSQIADTAKMIRDIGRYAKEHGDYLKQLSDSFADRLQDSARSYAMDLLASERRKLAELEKIMGRASKPRAGEDGHAS